MKVEFELPVVNFYIKNDMSMALVALNNGEVKIVNL